MKIETARENPVHMKIDIYDETYGGLKFLTRRVLRAGNTVRWGGRTWQVRRGDGGVWVLGEL